jgi:UPF0755 protein
VKQKILLLLETGLLLAGLILALLAGLQHNALEQPLQITAEQLLEVPVGATPSGVLNRLDRENVLNDAFWLRFYWRFNLPDQALHSGEYRLLPGMTAQDLLGLWQRGEVVQYNLALIEGWTFKQVRAALAAQNKLSKDLADLSDAQLMSLLGRAGENPEGRFFPDTYRYVSGMRDIDLLKQALARMDEILAQQWAGRAPDLPYAEPYQALIMASIVEKETGVPEERDEIAGVFLRRMKIGMLLQTDPTVIYGLGERYNGNLTRANLREPSAYNTYLNRGLPPTPIALVGQAAIYAALHPKAGKSLYFVARGDGSHVFSDNLNAHNRAVFEYQLKRRADYRSSPNKPDSKKDSQ